jgi:hypothetical protein
MPLRAFLGHDHVGSERALEAAAERVALHERDLGQRRAEEALRARVDVVDAELRVTGERLAVAGLDQHREQRQVATHVEDAAGARRGHVMVDRVANAVELDLAAVGDQLLVVREDVLQQAEAVAGGAILRIEVAPHRAGRRLELGFIL